MNTLKKNQPTNMLLFRSGFISQIFNYSVVNNSFNAIATIDITGLDINRLSVIVYGHRIDGSNDYATIPYVSLLGLFIIGGNAYGIDAGYQIVNNSVRIGFFAPTGFTPNSPYQTLYLSFYIFTY